MKLLNNFGLLYIDQGRLEDAKDMFRRALSGYQRRLGLEHSRTRGVMYNLAKLHRQQGKPEEVALVDMRKPMRQAQ